MSDVETNQAAREASGAHPYGRYLEEFEVGDVYKHWPAKTVTEGDHHLFCLLTMNHHPLHLNDVYAAASQQGRNVVVGPMVYSLALGMSVSDVSGKAIANLSTTATPCSSSPRCSRSASPNPSPTAGRSRSIPASSTRTACSWPSSSGSSSCRAGRRHRAEWTDPHTRM
jgi:hypothetical protein